MEYFLGNSPQSGGVMRRWADRPWLCAQCELRYSELCDRLPGPDSEQECFSLVLGHVASVLQARVWLIFLI